MCGGSRFFKVPQMAGDKKEFLYDANFRVSLGPVSWTDVGYFSLRRGESHVKSQVYYNRDKSCF